MSLKSMVYSPTQVAIKRDPSLSLGYLDEYPNSRHHRVSTVARRKPVKYEYATHAHAGVKLRFLMLSSVSEISAVLPNGTEPMLLGCPADTVTVHVQCPLHAQHRVFFCVPVVSNYGRMSVAQFCKYIATEIYHIIEQCKVCIRMSRHHQGAISLHEICLLSFDVHGTTVVPNMDCWLTKERLGYQNSRC
ncbi:hypothetical protein C8Q72DRAFT_868789 [Fomitopsis betulina]|nr:hypothetical protein C8Q72DRAFT_868789 [Fomitopsis betulina]